MTLNYLCPVGWGCRIPTPIECPRYDSKQSDCEVPVMLELWGMQSIPLLSLLQGPLWSVVVAPDSVLSMDHIEQNCVLMLNWLVWNGTVFVWYSELFEIELFWYWNCTYAKLYFAIELLIKQNKNSTYTKLNSLN